MEQTVAALEAHLECLEAQRGQRRAVYRAVRADYAEILQACRFAERMGDTPAGLEQDYLRRRFATEDSRRALQETQVALGDTRNDLSAARRRRRRGRVSVGYDGALWADVRAVGPDSDARVRYRQPSAMLGVEYDTPVRGRFSLRVGGAITLGISRVGVGDFVDVPFESDTTGIGLSALLNAGVRFALGSLFSIGPYLQLRVTRASKETARFTGTRRRLDPRVLVGLVLGPSAELQLGRHVPLRVVVEPGIGPALGFRPSAIILRLSASLAYAF